MIENCSIVKVGGGKLASRFWANLRIEQFIDVVNGMVMASCR
jgi:hypothetical protein